MTFLYDLVTNKVFLAGVLGMVISQFFKMIIISIKHKKFLFQGIFELAGMPSSHTSSVIALTTAIYLTEGISTLFIVCLLGTAYIIEEVLSMELSLGGISKLINKTISFAKKIKLLKSKDHKLQFKPMRERWGHTLGEVIAGAILGYLIARIIFI